MVNGMARSVDSHSAGTINLSHQNLSGVEIENLVRAVGSLSDHNISTIKLGFNNLRDDGAKIVATVLAQNASITCLDLGFCSISDEGVEALSKSLMQNSTLKILYLSGNSITDNGFRHLGSALQLNRSLEALFLTGNTGKTEGARYIAKGLKYNYSLSKLFLNGNRFERDGASSLSDTLITNHSITHLNLSDNNIGDSGLCSLTEALTNHRQLTELELSFNKITSVGMSTFVDCLVGYRSMKRLLLDNNKLGDAGAKALAAALSQMSLQTLNVGFNDIGSEGLSAILGYLSNPQQSTLTSLSLSGNTIDNVVAKELANMLICNLHLQELFIDRTNLTNVGERFIATGIASNKLCPVKSITGFEIGKVLTQLGSPAGVAQMNNEQALKYLNQVWCDLTRSTSLHQQQHKQATSDYIVSQQSNSYVVDTNLSMATSLSPSAKGSIPSDKRSENCGDYKGEMIASTASELVAVGQSQAPVSASQANNLSIASIPTSPPMMGGFYTTPTGIVYLPVQPVPSNVTAAITTTTIGAGTSSLSVNTQSQPQQQQFHLGACTVSPIPSTVPTLAPMPKRSRSSSNANNNNTLSLNRPSSSRPPSRTPPITQTRQHFQQEQLQQLQYQQQVERYHALLEAARQVPDLPFDARELQILTEFYYTPPSIFDGRHHPHQQQQSYYHNSGTGSVSASGTVSPYYQTCNTTGSNVSHTTTQSTNNHSANIACNITNINQVKRTSDISKTNNNNINNNSCNVGENTPQVMPPTAAALAQLREKSTHAITSASNTSTNNSTNNSKVLPLSSVDPNNIPTSTIDDDGNQSDAGTQTTVGHVHERTETIAEDDDDATSNRPWKRASNLTTMSRINYFPRIKVSLLDELRTTGSHGACLALLRQLRMLEISLLGLDALEIEEILLRDVLGLGRVVFHAAAMPYSVGYYVTTSNTSTYQPSAVYYNAAANPPPPSNNNSNTGNSANSVDNSNNNPNSTYTNVNTGGDVSTPQPSLQQQQQHMAAALYYYPVPNI